MMKNMSPARLSECGVWSGSLGVLAFLVSLILLWQGNNSLIMDKFDHKDFYYAGAGLMYVAIWFKLGALYHKN